ncbi:MAG: pantetheine-phosphate adenylyltransferase [Oscillospiraceae bacterium]|nr:pantetheine-phosphate adenylyltransferase [Candidatus Equicaccousia limihippi]
MKKSLAVCPGSFDPVTVGHTDVISRACSLFDEVVVLVSSNPNKTAMFTAQERVHLLEAALVDYDNVRVEYYDGLLADYTKKIGATAIVKGLRAMSDFEYEFQMALTNKRLNPATETVFLTTKAENMYLSSSMVKQVASMGGDISPFVPPVILQTVIDRIKTIRKEEKQ